MGDTAVGEFRSALKQALEAAEAAGVPLEMQTALLVSEVGNLVACWAQGPEFDTVIRNLQEAVAHAARTARDEARYQEAVERFVERWLN